MNKLLKKLSICLVAVMCVLSCFGCSCEQRLKIKYVANATRENADAEFTDKISMMALVEKKFREPANTPCYKRVDDRLELVKDSSVYKCLDAEGNEFERVTVGKVEKIQLEKNGILNTVSGDLKSYESSSIKMPNNEYYSLIYTFSLVNMSDKKMYIQKNALSLEGILDGQLKEESVKNKVTYSITGAKSDGDASYYYLNGYNNNSENNYNYDSITIVITLKNLTNKDSSDSRNKTLKLNLNVVVK